MTQWRYTSEKQDVVFRVLDNGSVESMLASLVPEGEQILPYIAPPIPVPSQVTMRQARLALLGAGLLSQVNAAIASLPSPDKEAAEIEWEYAAVVQRNSGLVPAMAQALGMTNAQLDALFIAAESL